MTVKAGHEEYLELAALYALGALDGEDRARFELHLASGCETCREAVRENEEILGDLALAAPLAKPPAAVRKRLFDRVRQDSEDKAVKSPGGSPYWMALAAAATIAAVGLGLYARTLHERAEEQYARAEEQRARAEEQRIAREGLERDLANLSATLEAFTAPATRAVSLAGQGPGQGAAAKAFVDPENRRLFLYVYNLPPPPAGQTYQLWLIVGGSPPVSMGVFGVETDGRARFDTASVPAFSGEVTVAVTIEPAGGVPQPTGPMVLVGT
ncbi:MAG TPA: anti-sigma factor [Vicinamibacteria bacterium]|nr:anti-sigma factor [Vicinamibacteria bacterium]